MKKENLTKLRFVRVLLIGLILSLSTTACSKESSEGTATLVIKSLGETKTERFKFTKGTPFGILKYNHKVDTVLNDNFVECIDEVCSDGEYIWLLYVNDKIINYGAKRYWLKDGDVVTFEFGKSKYVGEKE